MAEDKIKALMPVSGDWFVLTTEDNGAQKRHLMERVVLWALIENKGEISRVKAVGTDGIPHYEHESVETSFVYGPDLSPFGKTWNDLYAGIDPAPHGLREFFDPPKSLEKKKKGK